MQRKRGRCKSSRWKENGRRGSANGLKSYSDRRGWKRSAKLKPPQTQPPKPRDSLMKRRRQKLELRLKRKQNGSRKQRLSQNNNRPPLMQRRKLKRLKGMLSRPRNRNDRCSLKR